jgi:hypothetical protein
MAPHYRFVSINRLPKGMACDKPYIPTIFTQKRTASTPASALSGKFNTGTALKGVNTPPAEAGGIG